MSSLPWPSHHANAKLKISLLRYCYWTVTEVPYSLVLILDASVRDTLEELLFLNWADLIEIYLRLSVTMQYVRTSFHYL